MRKQLSLVILTLLSLLCAATLVSAEDKPLPKPDVLSEEAIFTSQKLSAYDTIVIRDLKLDNVEYSNIDSEETPKLEAMKPLLVKNVSNSLEMELKKRNLFNKIVRRDPPAGKAVIFEGEFTEINGGNRAMRFWVGFGAGKTYLKMKGRLVDAETGKELAAFEDRETGYRGSMTMENFAGLFPDQATSIGENIANFIEKLY